MNKAQTLKTDLAGRATAYLERGPIRRRLYRLARGFQEHRLAQAANVMAFDLFLAAIPLVALSGWAFATVLKNSPEALGAASSLLDQTPLEVRGLMLRNFGRFSSAGAVAPLAVVGSFWLASSAFHAPMKIFEVARGAERRPWWKKRLIALGCVLVAIASFGLSGYAFVLIVGGPIGLLEKLAAMKSSGHAELSHYAALLMGVATATALLAAFFRIAVHLPGVKRRVWPGALLSAGIGGPVSYGFGVYARTLAHFTMFYGSLAAVAIVLAWLWIWCAALLVGAELNAQLEDTARCEPPPSSRRQGVEASSDVPAHTPNEAGMNGLD
jgi:membrane protein